MMKFEDLMEKYYSSVEITRIPDRWSEYVPILVIKDDCWNVLLVYFIESEKSELKQAAFISSIDGSVEVLSQDDLRRCYNISKFAYKLDIEQNDAYFESKDEYIELLEKLFDKLERNEKPEVGSVKRLEYLISLIIPASILTGVYHQICGDKWKDFLI